MNRITLSSSLSDDDSVKSMISVGSIVFGIDIFLIPGESVTNGRITVRLQRTHLSAVCTSTGFFRSVLDCVPVNRRAPPLYSCKTTVSKDLLTLIFPLYSMNPSFLNLFMKKFTRDRVVPTILAKVSWETFGSTRSGCSCFP